MMRLTGLSWRADGSSCSPALLLPGTVGMAGRVWVQCETPFPVPAEAAAQRGEPNEGIVQQLPALLSKRELKPPPV